MSNLYCVVSSRQIGYIKSLSIYYYYCYNIIIIIIVTIIIITIIIIIIIFIIIDRLVGLVVSMSDYWSWGRGFDPRHFH